MQAVIYTKHEPPNHSPGGMLQMAYPMRRHAKAEIMKARLRPRYRATRSGPVSVAVWADILADRRCACSMFFHTQKPIHTKT